MRSRSFFLLFSFFFWATTLSAADKPARRLEIFIFNTAYHDVVYIKLPDAGELLINSPRRAELPEVLDGIQSVNLRHAPELAKFISKFLGWGYEVGNELFTRWKTRYAQSADYLIKTCGIKRVFIPFDDAFGDARTRAFIQKIKEKYGASVVSYYGTTKVNISYGALNRDVSVIAFGPDTFVQTTSDMPSKVRRSLKTLVSSLVYISFGNFDMFLDFDAAGRIKQRVLDMKVGRQADILYTVGARRTTFINYISPQRIIWAGRINEETERNLQGIYQENFLKAYSYVYHYIYVVSDGQNVEIHFE